jgi:hypothetical protein
MQQIVTNGQYNYWAPRTREGHSDDCTALALMARAAGTATHSAPPRAFSRRGARQQARRNRSVDA